MHETSRDSRTDQVQVALGFCREPVKKVVDWSKITNGIAAVQARNRLVKARWRAVQSKNKNAVGAWSLTVKLRSYQGKTVDLLISASLRESWFALRDVKMRFAIAIPQRERSGQNRTICSTKHLSNDIPQRGRPGLAHNGTEVVVLD